MGRLRNESAGVQRPPYESVSALAGAASWRPAVVKRAVTAAATPPSPAAGTATAPEDADADGTTYRYTPRAATANTSNAAWTGTASTRRPPPRTPTRQRRRRSARAACIRALPPPPPPSLPPASGKGAVAASAPSPAAMARGAPATPLVPSVPLGQRTSGWRGRRRQKLGTGKEVAGGGGGKGGSDGGGRQGAGVTAAHRERREPSAPGPSLTGLEGVGQPSYRPRRSRGRLDGWRGGPEAVQRDAGRGRVRRCTVLRRQEYGRVPSARPFLSIVGGCHAGWLPCGVQYINRYAQKSIMCLRVTQCTTAPQRREIPTVLGEHQRRMTDPLVAPDVTWAQRQSQD